MYLWLKFQEHYSSFIYSSGTLYWDYWERDDLCYIMWLDVTGWEKGWFSSLPRGLGPFPVLNHVCEVERSPFTKNEGVGIGRVTAFEPSIESFPLWPFYRILAALNLECDVMFVNKAVDGFRRPSAILWNGMKNISLHILLCVWTP